MFIDYVCKETTQTSYLRIIKIINTSKDKKEAKNRLQAKLKDLSEHSSATISLMTKAIRCEHSKRNSDYGLFLDNCISVDEIYDYKIDIGANEKYTFSHNFFKIFSQYIGSIPLKESYKEAIGIIGKCDLQEAKEQFQKKVEVSDEYLKKLSKRIMKIRLNELAIGSSDYIDFVENCLQVSMIHYDPLYDNS